MPCDADRWRGREEVIAADALRRRLDDATRAACTACKLIDDPKGAYLLIDEEHRKAWWENHRREDAERDRERSARRENDRQERAQRIRELEKELEELRD